MISLRWAKRQGAGCLRTPEPSPAERTLAERTLAERIQYGSRDVQYQEMDRTVETNSRGLPRSS